MQKLKHKKTTFYFYFFATYALIEIAEKTAEEQVYINIRKTFLNISS